MWRGCRRREIGLGQGCLHWPALPPSFTPPQRPLSPLIPCGLPLPACLPAATPAAFLCPGHQAPHREGPRRRSSLTLTAPGATFQGRRRRSRSSILQGRLERARLAPGPRACRSLSLSLGGPEAGSQGHRGNKGHIYPWEAPVCSNVSLLKGEGTNASYCPGVRASRGKLGSGWPSWIRPEWQWVARG